MATEYSISVDWQEECDKWGNIGQDVMREFYESHPKEAEKDGHDLNNAGEIEYLDEVLDSWQPMMNYAYPLMCDPMLFDDGKDKVIKVCRETCLTVMYNENEDTHYLALCGGGMDLSQSIAYAYQILENWMPISLLRNVNKQPELSVYGKEWLKMATQITKQLGSDISHLQRDLEDWQNSIAEYKARVKTKAMASRL